ncbi:MAG: dynamin family protein, partial [Singulisphaera sp.]|nr:dynamin family protein [Singulisphaera sp.]
MRERTWDPHLIFERIAEVRRELGSAIAESGNERLLQLWPHWDSDLLEILQEGERRPEVPIALLGGAGCGKSTLINALIGMRLLPMADGKPCTSAVTEVAYGEGPKYEAIVTFTTREEWRREFDLILKELAEVPPDRDDSTASPVSLGNARRASRDKIMAVYGLDDPTLVTLGRLNGLTEPPEINRCFEMRVERLESNDPRKFAKDLKRYLHSDARFWPIVKHVRIRGPFPALESGATLIDLPGLNDPNQARESVTRGFLKSARFVWVIFNVKRAMGNDLFEVMRSEDFHRNLVLDGREGALTFVATASDAIDPALAIEKFDLDDDATTAEAILANNRESKKIVRHQLNDLGFDYRMMAGGDTPQVHAILERLKQSPIFTVSSREFLRLAGLA